MAKFRGNSDDWLDANAERDARGRIINRSKRRIVPKNVDISARVPQVPNGIVVQVFPKQCLVRQGNTTDGFKRILCTYRRAQLSTWQTQSGTKERSPVCVGDHVAIEGERVLNLFPRENELSRPSPGRGEESIHVLAANIASLCIVASRASPDFSPGLIDRFLIGAQQAGIPVNLCITKGDLQRPDQTDPAPWLVYRPIVADIFDLSVRPSPNSEVERFRNAISIGNHVFCGHSGTGKTSLLRALLNHDIGAIGNVNDHTGKGKHTTTSSLAYDTGTGDSLWIDTPGIKAFSLKGVICETLKDFYPEFEKINCQNKSCLHYDEDGCAASGLARYDSYRRIYDSIKSGEM